MNRDILKQEKELAQRIEEAKKLGDIDEVKSLTQELIELQETQDIVTASEEDLVRAGVDLDKLTKEKELQLAIEAANKLGDRETAKELMSELIEIQGGQPQVGAKFG